MYQFVFELVYSSKCSNIGVQRIDEEMLKSFEKLKAKGYD